jgi:hypothetical protein
VVLMLFDFGMRIARIHGPDTRATFLNGISTS